MSDLLSFELKYGGLLTAYDAARQSRDPSTQNGAVLVDPHAGAILYETAACNRFPNGVAYLPERLERPLKYQIVAHAEFRSILLAARLGIPTEGLILVAGWAACENCAKTIIEAGVKGLVRHAPPDDGAMERWRSQIELADQMLAEARVWVEEYVGELGCSPVLRDGELWHP